MKKYRAVILPGWSGSALVSITVVFLAEDIDIATMYISSFVRESVPNGYLDEIFQVTE